MDRELVLTGLQPSGVLTLRNYLGVLRNWRDIQEKYECMCLIADLHAITLPRNPETLKANTKNIFLQCLACGLDPAKNVIFLQSQVYEHTQLAWVLGCNAYMAELSRMYPFKGKFHQERAKVGALDYPVLMAADILLYQAKYVPVISEQVEHVEFTREIAKRFNSIYGKTIFNVPEAHISFANEKISNLKRYKKILKSDSNPLVSVSLLDDRDTIIEKFRKAETDSLNQVKYSDEQPEIKSLINIYSSITGKTISGIESEFEGRGYGIFKKAVAEVVADELAPIQSRYYELDVPENEQYIKKILNDGAKVASEKAKETMKEVYGAVGFYS